MNNEKDNDNKKNLNNQLLKYKKINNRNSGIIIVLLGMLLFVCVICVYVRFLGWLFTYNEI